MVEQRVKLTKRVVDGVVIPETGETWLWDTDLKGFFLRVRPSGRKVYAVRYRLGSKQNVYTIGVHGSPWTPEAARDAAFTALGRVQAGENPTDEKRAARKALSVKELIDVYLKDGPATKPAKRASTWTIDASNLRRHIEPLLGGKLADKVTKAEAARAIRDVTDGKTATNLKTGQRGRVRVTGGEGTARRTRITVAAMFAWGVEHGMTKYNPFASVKLTAPAVRERFLNRDEAARFLDALTALEGEGSLSKTFADAIRILLLTGARKTEILGLQWSEVDLDRRMLVLPPARTKAGGKTGERRIVLSPPALAILKGRRSVALEEATRQETADAPSPHVFPAARGDGHAIGLRRVFLKAAARAEVGQVRVHDLRHSFASFAVADGASLFLVSKLLGHSSARTAERYAHLSGDPLEEAAAAIGRRLVPTKPADEQTGEVVKLPSKRGG